MSTMTTKTIEVRVNRNHSDALTSDEAANASVMACLKKAGIPVVGTISIRGVKTGALTISTEGSDYVYSWTGNAAKKKQDEDLI